MTRHEKFTVLDETVTYNFRELCSACQVQDELVHDMISEGILTPLGESPKSWVFSSSSIKKVQITMRLQQDLRVNLPGVALALELLEELDELRSRVAMGCK